MLIHRIFQLNNFKDVVLFKSMMMVFVLILVLAFNIGGLNNYTIRRDELTTLGHIGALEKNNEGISIASTIASLTLYSTDHSPAYYAIANIWGHFVGFNYFALRMLSLWFGVISVAATFWIGRHLISHSAGLLAAVIMGTNVVFYANFHEMREWSMMLMLSILTLACYFHLAYKQKNLRPIEIILLFLLVALSLYTSYLSIFVLVAIGFHHLLFMPKTKSWWQISITVVLAGLTFIPWLPVVDSGVTTLQETANLDELVIPNGELLSAIPIFWGNGLSILFGAGIFLGFLSSIIGWGKSRYIFFFLVTITASFMITNEALSIVKQIRYLLLWLLPFALFIGSGLALLTPKKVTRFIPILFIGLWIVSGVGLIQTDLFNDYLTKDRSVRYAEYNGLVPLLRENTEKRDLLILAQYESSAVKRSKQGLLSIQDYYLNPLKLTITNFPQYSQWAGSGIDADSVEYAMGLVPGREEFWLSYHYTKITDDIIRFQDQMNQDFHICHMSRYGQESILIHYVANSSKKSCKVTSQLNKKLIKQTELF